MGGVLWGLSEGRSFIQYSRGLFSLIPIKTLVPNKAVRGARPLTCSAEGRDDDHMLCIEQDARRPPDAELTDGPPRMARRSKTFAVVGPRWTWACAPLRPSGRRGKEGDRSRGKMVVRTRRKASRISSLSSGKAKG
jgi:hypothetical protein